MYKINNNSNKAVNEELALIRQADQAQYLELRKVYSNLSCKVFDILPETGHELIDYVSLTDMPALTKLRLCNTLIEWMAFEEIEELAIPVIDIPADEDRFAFIGTTSFADMTPHQLSLVLFRDLGTEVEVTTNNLTTGLKLKLDMLDELKDMLVSEYPAIRTEVLTEKLANALAVTKLEKSSSLALAEGNLAVYDYLATSKKIDSANFLFLAEIGGDKTKSLDILILQSVFKTYKEEVSKGHLPTTSADLNIAIMKCTSGAKPTTEASISKVKGLF